VVAQINTTETNQEYVLRLYGTGKVFVEDVHKYLNALEHAYNCAYVLETITQQAEELANQYTNMPFPIPLRNLLWGSWWPPSPEKVAGLIPSEDRLKLKGVELNSPGFWDFMGKLNPLEVLRQYLNDRHKQRKDGQYRESAEARKLELENKLLELQVVKQKLQLLKDMGASNQDLSLIRDQLLYRPLQGLNSSQDQGLILEAEIFNLELEKKKEPLTPLSNQDVITVNRQGKIIKRIPLRAKYFTENLGSGVILEMANITGGKFLMGSPKDENYTYDGERPQHEVTVPSFSIGKFPITQAQWRAVCEAVPPASTSRNDLKVSHHLKIEPSAFQGDDNRPVEQVSWYDAVEFCDRLSQLTGRKYRLPSEAEWEYACRAGTTTPFYFGKTLKSDLANYQASETIADEPKGKYRQETTPVGQFPPNAFGLYDLHGQVWEWCADTWHDNYENAPTDGSAWITPSDNNAVLRGGSWALIPFKCRSAFRYFHSRSYKYVTIGFRVVSSFS
jgi:formylglycine-generating enzyme required for sulfatase activity